MKLTGKKITVGITGGIAVYKAAELVSWLHGAEAAVQVVMTPAAQRFVTPLTMKTLSGRPVLTDVFSEDACWQVPHIDAAACDLFLIVPASADFLAKAACGLADDALTASLLATNAPVLAAPAMNTVMYANPATQHNLRCLQERGWHFVGPDEGRLACGSSGPGRLADLEAIKTAILALLGASDVLQGLSVLVSAGPTREYLDPVRYLSNSSSGRMGYEIAAAAQLAGAAVRLVSGPSACADPPGVAVTRVTTALEMHDALLAAYPQADLVIMAAAVADYRPAETAAQKLKKNAADPNEERALRLVRNPDILAEMGAHKGDRFLVGFAAETDHLADYAVAKLKEKNLDLIIANDVTQPGAGFAVATNIASAFYLENGVLQRVDYPLQEKSQLARCMIELIGRLLPAR